MKFAKPFMSFSELQRAGIPEAMLNRVYNTPHQTIAFKSGKHKQSKIIFDTKQLQNMLENNIEKEQAMRGII